MTRLKIMIHSWTRFNHGRLNRRVKLLTYRLTGLWKKLRFTALVSLMQYELLALVLLTLFAVLCARVMTLFFRFALLPMMLLTFPNKILYRRGRRSVEAEMEGEKLIKDEGGGLIKLR